MVLTTERVVLTGSSCSHEKWVWDESDLFKIEYPHQGVGRLIPISKKEARELPQGRVFIKITCKSCGVAQEINPRLTCEHCNVQRVAYPAPKGTVGMLMQCPNCKDTTVYNPS